MPMKACLFFHSSCRKNFTVFMIVAKIKCVFLRKSNESIYMDNKINHLSKTEQELIHIAPILISALVSGADGEFHPDEIAKAVKIIHIKSYSETKAVSGVYQNIVAHSEEMIDSLISNLPESTLERNDVLIDKLKGLNDIFTKLDIDFALDLLKSLKELAYYVSVAGNDGIGFQNDQEKEIAKLPFLNIAQ